MRFLIVLSLFVLMVTVLQADAQDQINRVKLTEIRLGAAAARPSYLGAAKRRITTGKGFLVIGGSGQGRALGQPENIPISSGLKPNLEAGKRRITTGKGFLVVGGSGQGRALAQPADLPIPSGLQPNLEAGKRRITTGKGFLVIGGSGSGTGRTGKGAFSGIGGK